MLTQGLPSCPWMLPGQCLHSDQLSALDLTKGPIVRRGGQPLSWGSSRKREIEGICSPHPQIKDHWTYWRPRPRSEAWGQGMGEIYVGLPSSRQSWDQDGP